MAGGDDRTGISRRGYLGLGAAAVAAAVTPGAVSSQTESAGIQFDRVVDAVDDLGLDPSEGAQITSTLSDVQSGTLVTFPSGRYQLDDSVIRPNEGVGFVAQSGADVTWVFPDGYTNQFVTVDAEEFLHDGIDIDYGTGQDTSGHFQLNRVGTRGVIRNVDFIGRGRPSGYAVNVGDVPSDAVVRLQNVNAPHGGNPSNYFDDLPGRIGVSAGPGVDGTLQVVDCLFAEFGNNGLYAEAPRGDVQVEGCTFRNNGASQAKLGGAGSYFKNCLVEIDMTKYDGPDLDDWTTQGLKLGDYGPNQTLAERPANDPGCLIEGCDILLKNIDDNGAVAAAIKVSSTHRAAVIRDCNIQVDIDTGFGRSPHAILRANPLGDWNDYRSDQDNPDEPYDITVENVSVVGDAADDAAVRIVNSPDSLVDSSCIQQTGSDRTGVRVFGSDGSVIQDSNINVTADAVDINGGDVTTSNITYSESCSISTDGGDDSADDGDDSTDDGSTTLSNTVLIKGTGSTAEYEFTVDEAIEKNGDKASINDGDVIDGTTATGVVGSGDDAYDYETEITDFTLSGDANVYVNGSQVDPATLGSDDTTDDGSTTLSNTVLIEGTGSTAEYEFTVDEAIEKNGDKASVNDGDVIDGTTVTGVVGSGDDAYDYETEVTDFTLSGDANVYVNGSQVDPATLGSDDSTDDGDDSTDDGSTTLSNTVLIEGTGPTAEYEFSVNEAIEKNSDQGTINDGDVIDGTTATGVVGSGDDAYDYETEVTDFTLSGDANVYVNGTEVDPSTLGSDDSADDGNDSTDDGSTTLSNTVLVEGTGSTAEYEFTVDEAIEKNSDQGSVNEGDVIDGTTATGVVGSGDDAYDYETEITSFTLSGDANVYVNGTQVDPGTLGDTTLPNTLVFGGTGSETNYEFSVSGDVEKASDLGSIDDGDVVDGTSVSGSVTNEKDGYRFSGDLYGLAVDGDANLQFEDNDG